jgi:hypothetical protein
MLFAPVCILFPSRLRSAHWENTIANLQSCAKTGYQMETGIFASYISGSLSENLPVTI